MLSSNVFVSKDSARIEDVATDTESDTEKTHLGNYPVPVISTFCEVGNSPYPPVHDEEAAKALNVSKPSPILQPLLVKQNDPDGDTSLYPEREPSGLNSLQRLIGTHKCPNCSVPFTPKDGRQQANDDDPVTDLICDHSMCRKCYSNYLPCPLCVKEAKMKRSESKMFALEDESIISFEESDESCEVAQNVQTSKLKLDEKLWENQPKHSASEKKCGLDEYEKGNKMDKSEEMLRERKPKRRNTEETKNMNEREEKIDKKEEIDDCREERS